MSAAQRVVLDTNTVMALWWFEDPTLAPLARSIEAGELALFARPDTIEELSRVLAYRQFGIPLKRRHAILEGYRARCTPAPDTPPDAAPLPDCRDTDDQKFLELARDARATLLVSRDKALLRLDRHRFIRPLYRIRTPEAVCQNLIGASPQMP
jgi:putative PIN family toxin of toxin-antitoxin system